MSEAYNYHCLNCMKYSKAGNKYVTLRKNKYRDKYFKQYLCYECHKFLCSILEIQGRLNLVYDKEFMHNSNNEMVSLLKSFTFD